MREDVARCVDAALSVTREHVERQTRYALHGDEAHPGWDCLAPAADGPWVRLADVLALLGEASATPEPSCICGHAGLGEHALHPDCPLHGGGPGGAASLPSHTQEQP